MFIDDLISIMGHTDVNKTWFWHSVESQNARKAES